MEKKRVIKGRRPVLEALRAGTTVKRILLQEGLITKPLPEIRELARQLDIPVAEAEKETLDKLAGGANHQGVVAEAGIFRYAGLDELLAARPGEPPFLLALDHLEDPHNFGALLRTAYAAGCHGAIIPERRAVQVTPTVVKTSAGATERLPVARVVNLVRALKECKEAGLWVYGADMDGELLYTEGDYRQGTVIVIGGEGKGLSRLVRETCDRTVRLPMKGEMSSLNASVAGALLLYEVLRQRNNL